MTNTNFFIVGKHPVIEALKNPQRKVLRLFLTEESKKNIHRISPKRNLLKDLKVFYKTKKDVQNISNYHYPRSLNDKLIISMIEQNIIFKKRIRRF